MNDYPFLEGDVTLQVRLEDFYKGTKPDKEYVNITFEFNQLVISGCPDLILDTVHGGRWVWYKTKNKYEVKKFDHNEHKKIIKKI